MKNLLLFSMFFKLITSFLLLTSEHESESPNAYPGHLNVLTETLKKTFLKKQFPQKKFIDEFFLDARKNSAMNIFRRYKKKNCSEYFIFTTKSENGKHNLFLKYDFNFTLTLITNLHNSTSTSSCSQARVVSSVDQKWQADCNPHTT